MNVNDDVWVLLTASGERMWNEYWKLSSPGGVPDAIRKSATESDGTIRFQLHQLMHIFGPALYHGSSELPFVDNKVLLR